MEWFKMQTAWGKSVDRLSDAEAGRFIKALFAYVNNAEEYDGSSGREDPVIWQALDAIRGDIEAFRQSESDRIAHKQAVSEKRRNAAKARWGMQTDANACKPMQLHANASKCMQMHDFASPPLQPPVSKNEKKIINTTKNTPPNPPQGFTEFWSEYPKKQGKQDALRAFTKLKPDDGLLSTMLTSLRAWKGSQQWTKQNGQFIPLPATWLNGRRWEDEIQANGSQSEEQFRLEWGGIA